MKQHNIAFIICSAFDPDQGGVQRSTSKLARIFSAQGHSVVIISTAAGKDHEWEGVPVLFVGEAGHKRMQELLRTQGVSIVINQMGLLLGVTKMLEKSMDPHVKLINTLRLNPLNFLDNHADRLKEYLAAKKLLVLNSWILRKLLVLYHIAKQRRDYTDILKTADAFVMLSESFREELFQLVPGAKRYNAKITAIPNPFYIEEVDLSSLKKEKVFLFVGRLNIPQKRIDLLLKVWKQLHDQLPDWKFLVVGDGPERSNMEGFCKENGLNRVSFFGYANPVPFYKKAKILSFTSAYEGFGNVLVEAQMYGCVPVLFDSYAAASEIVRNETDGFLVKPFDLTAFTTKSLELAHDEEVLAAMSRAAVENVKKYDIENVVQMWYGLFDKIGMGH